MQSYAPLPPLPSAIAQLNTLAYNLWWSWNPLARWLFQRIDEQRWQSVAHNPVLALHLASPAKLTALAQDPAFIATYARVMTALEGTAAGPTWWEQQTGARGSRSIAYFSAEFALHRSLPIYAGGLGVLAGDHCKEASDLGVPLIAVGLMYPKGYFHQTLTPDGWQQEIYEQLDWSDAPIEPALTSAQLPCRVTVQLENRDLRILVWQVRVGRVTLYLLDTDVEENHPADREVSAQLYGGDREMRARQEIVLGIGGVRALRALGVQPGVWHLNEGHAAFVALERLHEFHALQIPFDAALDLVRRSTIFTTHTPVPAGHDAFPFELVERHLSACWGGLGSLRDRLLALGAYDNGFGSQFNMTALAIRSAGAVNAVSKLHREVTVGMLEPMWPGVTPADRPVRAVTNGVHVPTWIADELAGLFDRRLGADWLEHQDDVTYWDQLLAIPDEELWAVRQSLRARLIAFVRDRGRHHWARDSATATQIVAGGALLDPAALTIGFARRFTGYKRPELVFRDPQRLRRILTSFGRPVQLVLAGKAHPADEAGKQHLKRVYQYAIDPAFEGRVAFIDDYDLHVARFLVQGCDVWLNTPRKPLEASGTSGMKAGLNGVLHCSIGDGWWAEGYNGANGWLIDGRSTGTDPEVDDADADALYHLLESEIVSAFYERDGNIPCRWIAKVKESVRTTLPHFSARRMVKDYAKTMYIDARREAREESPRDAH